MSINKRIEYLRKNLGLNQKDFGEKIGLKKSAASWIEKEGNVVIDQNKRIICDKFRVSLRWLETGEGDMYVQDTQSDVFEVLRQQYHMNDAEETILRSYFGLPEEHRHIITDFLRSISTRPAEEDGREKSNRLLDQELDDYRQELEAEQKDASLSGTGKGGIKGA